MVVEKSPGIKRFLNCLAVKFFGQGREQDVCAICIKPVGGRGDFRDDLSWREYQLSKMCQDCQDELWQGW